MSEQPPSDPASTQDDAAQVSFMITLAQKHLLRQLGYDDTAIGDMTPQDAHRILKLI
jgi:hypothetical protein